MDERLERHLCNLHNEVFEAAESRINTECSLTIREGISASDCSKNAGRVVPSLYVRVYRVQSYPFTFLRRSLTIREGISRTSAGTARPGGFPHYT